MGADGGETRGTGAGADPPPEALTRRSGFLLSALGRRSRDATEGALARLDLKPMHYGVLVVLADAGPVTQQVVGARLGIDKSTMVVVVDHLEGRGLVERRRNPGDRRAYELTLTDAGRHTLAMAGPLVAGVEEAVLAPLDEAARARLHALLLQLLRGAD